MEVRFAKLLNENGVKAEQTTAKIKELIETFNEAWEEYQEKIEEVENASEDEQDALVEEIEQFESDLSEADTEIYKKIQSWLKNKDTWEANAQRMAQGRANKSAQKASPTPINTPTSGETINQNNGTNTFTIEEPKEDKKKSSGVWWLAGFVAVVTLGAVVMKRD
jgi:chromosome segregation ATPase